MKISKSKIILTLLVNILLLLGKGSITAQQMPLTSHDYMNPIIYNPAEIGKYDYLNINLHTRRQWVGIQGSPETYILTADGAIENKNIGLGIIFCNDVTDIISRFSGSVGYRYAFKLPGEQNGLRLGLMGSYIQNTINFDQIRSENSNDPTLFSNRERRSGFDANAGLQYHYQKLKVGLSVYQLFGSDLQYRNLIDQKSLNFQFIRHFQIMGSYDFSVNESYNVQPRFLVKSVQGMTPQVDIGVYTEYMKKLWGGITWQQSYGLSFVLGGNFYSRYSLGYSFDLPLGAISKFTSGSHEIVIGVKLYKTHTEKLQPLNNISSNSDVEKLKKISKEQDEQIEQLQAENKAMKQALANTNQTVELQKEEYKDLQKIFTNDSANIKAVINKYSTRLDQLDRIDFKSRYKKVGSTYIDTTIDGSSRNTKFYIVLGTFLKYSDARLLQRVFAREINLTTYIIPEVNNIFFVYSARFSDTMGVKNKIKKQIHILEKKGVGKFIQGDIWIYKSKK